MVSSTAGSIFTLSSSSQAIWLSLTRIVRAEFSGCMKGVFKPFLMMKVAGTVFVFSLALNRMGSHMSKSAIASSLTLRPNKSSTGVWSSSLKCCDVSSVPFAGMLQMTH